MNEKVGGPAALVLTATVARRYDIDGETKSEHRWLVTGLTLGAVTGE